MAYVDILNMRQIFIHRSLFDFKLRSITSILSLNYDCLFRKYFFYIFMLSKNIKYFYQISSYIKIYFKN